MQKVMGASNKSFEDRSLKESMKINENQMVAKQTSGVSSGGIKVLDQQVVKNKKEGAGNDLGEDDYEYDEESYYEEEAQPHNQKTDENLIGGDAQYRKGNAAKAQVNRSASDNS